MDNPIVHPPDPVKLQADREVRLKKKQMKYIIYDVIWYFIFVCVLLSVAYGNKDASAYDTTSTMSGMFEDSSYTGWISLAEVKKQHFKTTKYFQGWIKLAGGVIQKLRWPLTNNGGNVQDKYKKYRFCRHFETPMLPW